MSQTDVGRAGAPDLVRLWERRTWSGSWGRRTSSGSAPAEAGGPARGLKSALPARRRSSKQGPLDAEELEEAAFERHIGIRTVTKHASRALKGGSQPPEDHVARTRPLPCHLFDVFALRCSRSCHSCRKVFFGNRGNARERVHALNGGGNRRRLLPRSPPSIRVIHRPIHAIRR